MPVFGSPIWWTLISTFVLGVGIGVLAQPQLAVRYMTVKSPRELDRAVAIGGVFILMMTGVAFTVGALSNLYFVETTDSVAIIAAGGDVERIIPLYIQGALPGWFGVLFMLTLLSAAMSTLSGQFHTMGTSLGRDLLEEAMGRRKAAGGMLASRAGVLIGIIMAALLGYYLEWKFGEEGIAIVARGTALFFGLCAASFLPMYAGGLWFKRITKAGAITGMCVGAMVSLLWMFFIKETEATAFMLCERLFGVPSLAIEMVGEVKSYRSTGKIIWAFVDPMLVALPLSAIVTWLVSLFTRPPNPLHVQRCFGGQPRPASPSPVN